MCIIQDVQCVFYIKFCKIIETLDKCNIKTICMFGKFFFVNKVCSVYSTISQSDKYTVNKENSDIKS